MRRIALALVLLLAGIGQSFAASQGFVVASCPGVLGVNAYTAGQFGNITVDVNGNSCVSGNITTTPAVPANGTAGAGYPPGAIPVAATASAAGTAIINCTLPAAAGRFTYITGFEIGWGFATAASNVPITVNTVGGSLSYLLWVPATTQTVQQSLVVEYPIAIPSTAVATAINVTWPATPGSNLVAISCHGYQQ